MALALAGMAVAAPRVLVAARERVTSLVGFDSDLSVRYRITEMRTVKHAIDEHRITGSGLGATVLWGRAYEGVCPTAEAFAHNGYL